MTTATLQRGTKRSRRTLAGNYVREMYWPCEVCGKSKWTQIRRGEPVSRICCSCSTKGNRLGVKNEEPRGQMTWVKVPRYDEYGNFSYLEDRRMEYGKACRPGASCFLCEEKDCTVRT